MPRGVRENLTKEQKTERRRAYAKQYYQANKEKFKDQSRSQYRLEPGGPKCGNNASTVDRTKATFDPVRDGLAQWASPQAELLGDPPRGRSALDQRQMAECCTIAPRS